jgi:hypothetical protein
VATRSFRFEPPVRQRQPSLVDEIVRAENDAAALFEARWTRRALRRVDPELEQRLGEQRELLSGALASGIDRDIRLHGEAMVRGWHAAIARMATEPPGAFLIGEDPASGMRVAISDQRASETTVRDLYGDGVIFLTPDEVAAMATTLQQVREVKRLWPGAEIVTVQKKEVTGA